MERDRLLGLALALTLALVVVVAPGATTAGPLRAYDAGDEPVEPLVPSAVEPLASAWSIEMVDDAWSSGTGHISLALDPSGRPHISYQSDEDDLPRDLKYAHRTGGVWDIQVVDTVGDVGRHTSLALDSLGYPHISYQDPVNHNVKYAYWTGNTWNVQIVDSEGDMGCGTALALDAADRPHISYCYYQVSQDPPSTSVTYLKHAHWTGDTWDIQIVDNPRVVESRGISLVLDGSDHPHIGYCTGGRALKYAHWTGTAWDVQTVDYVGSPCHVSLALDGTGFPHIGYTDNWHTHHVRACTLKYAHWTGGAWDTETVISEGCLVWFGGCEDFGGPYSFVSLAMDSSDRPSISYRESRGLKLARWTGTGWDIQMVDSGTGPSTSLAFDTFGDPHIGYCVDSDSTHLTDCDLKHAHRLEGTWYTQMVDSIGDVGAYSSLALNGLGLAHISTYDATNGDLKYAWETFRFQKVATPADEVVHDGTVTYTLSLIKPISNARLWDPLPPGVDYVTGSITSTLTPPAIYSPTADAVVWQGTLSTGTVDSIQFQATPEIAFVKSLAAPQEVINTSWLTDTANGQAITSTASTTLMPIPLSLDIEAIPCDGVRKDDLLTYTLIMSGPGLEVRLWDPLPPMVRYVPGSIAGTLVPTPVYSPTAHAIVWEGTLSTDTVGTIRFHATPEITFVKSLAAPQVVTNTGWLTATQNGRVITATASTTVMPIPFSLDIEAVPRDGVRNNDLLTYTLAMSGAGLEVLLWDPLPPMVRYVPGSIAGTLVPTPVYSPTAHAIVWEGTLPTDMVKTIRFQVTPGITGTGSLDLSGPIVNTAWLEATESGRRVWASVIVNGHHIYIPFVLRESSA